MLRKRLIPIMLIDGRRLVKTVRFEKPSYVGDPINAIKIFNEKEVDEIYVIDYLASRREAEINFKIVEELASECFMPLMYGGGIHSLRQADMLFSLGVEKVCLHSGALENPELVASIAEKYGNQAVSVAVDIKRDWRKKLRLYNSKYGKCERHEIASFVKSMISLGVGEIVLTCIDKEGTMAGPDLESIKLLAGLSPVPLVANGGIGSLHDMRRALAAGASAVAAGSFFVFHGPHRAVLITYPKQEELNFLNGVGAT